MQYHRPRIGAKSFNQTAVHVLWVRNGYCYMYVPDTSLSPVDSVHVVGLSTIVYWIAIYSVSGR